MKTILAAIDFSPSSARVLRFASEAAKASGARVILVHIATPGPDFVSYAVGPETERKAVAERFRNEHRELQSLADTLRDDGLDATALLIQGATVEKILEEADKVNADTIVVGSHGRGAIGRVLLGSISEGVVRNAHCPVTVIPALEKAHKD